MTFYVRSSIEHSSSFKLIIWLLSKWILGDEILIGFKFNTGTVKCLSPKLQIKFLYACVCIYRERFTNTQIHRPHFNQTNIIGRIGLPKANGFAAILEPAVICFSKQENTIALLLKTS